MINNRIANGTKIRQSHFHGRATKTRDFIRVALATLLMAKESVSNVYQASGVVD
jgi:hypothetical protein